MSEIRKLINSKIKYYREKNGISQEDLSVAINRNKNFIEKLENNEYAEFPTLPDIILIAKQLKISVNDLLWFPEIRKIIEEKDYKKKESRFFLEKLHKNSISNFVSCLYAGGDISSEEIAELKRFIESAGKEE